jgi:hypothetical protein
LPAGFDPRALLERVTAEAPPTPASTTFGLKLDTPDQHVSASGALVVEPPGRFRIEVRGPIGPPVLVIVSDGKALYAWQAGKNTFYSGPDADSAIRAYTGGAVGLEALAALFTGRLPHLGPADEVADGRPEYTWHGPGQSRLFARLAPETGRLSALSLHDEAGQDVLEAQMAGADRPSQLSVTLPTVGGKATLDMGDWRPATPPPAAFVLSPPPGAEVKPLVWTAPAAEAPAAP